MGTVQIRISKKAKAEIDVLMEEAVREVFEKGVAGKASKILKDGYSYADFLDDLVAVYRKSKSCTQCRQCTQR